MNTKTLEKKNQNQRFYPDFEYAFRNNFVKNLLYYDQEIRDLIRKSDLMKCAQCKREFANDKNLRKCSVHEIECFQISIEEYFSFDNRITLCDSCHAKTSFNRATKEKKREYIVKEMKKSHKSLILKRENYDYHKTLYQEKLSSLLTVYNEMFEKCKEIYTKNFPESYEQYVQYKNSNISS